MGKKSSVIATVIAGGLAFGMAPAAWAGSTKSGTSCTNLPSYAQLKAALIEAVAEESSGLDLNMWGTIVNRDGVVCAVAFSGADRHAQWPGSRVISAQKAYTANAFSLDDFALSTARLYTFTQPGHSLWSLGQSNLFDTGFLNAPGRANDNRGDISGGLIFFGGGVPLYRHGRIIGGLGVSGDTSCADHEIAKRVRDLAGLNPVGGKLADDIVYTYKHMADPALANPWIWFYFDIQGVAAFAQGLQHRDRLGGGARADEHERPAVLLAVRRGIVGALRVREEVPRLGVRRQRLDLEAVPDQRVARAVRRPRARNAARAVARLGDPLAGDGMGQENRRDVAAAAAGALLQRVEEFRHADGIEAG